MAYLKDRLVAEHYVEEVMEFGFRVRSSKPKLINKKNDQSENDKLFTLFQA